MEKGKVLINKVYKYKMLCELLNEDIKGGKSKQLQLKDWERFFKIEKLEKANFIIREIYSIPLPKINNRGKNPNSRSNNTTYGKFADVLLLNYFADKDIIYTTNNKLSASIGLVGINYSCINRNRYKFKQYLYNNNTKISITAINNVLADIYNTVKSVIPSSLSRLQREGYITFTQDYIMYKNNKGTMASKEERLIINNAEKQILKEMDITTQQKNFNYTIRNKYYGEVEKLVKQEIDDVKNYYTGYKIVVVKNKDNEDNVNECKKNLQELLIQKVKNNMCKIKKEIEEKYDFADDNKMWIKNIINTDYLSNIDCVVNYVLKTKHDLIREIENTQVELVEE